MTLLTVSLLGQPDSLSQYSPAYLLENAIALREQEPESALQFAQAGLKQALSLKDSALIADFYVQLGIIFKNTGEYSLAYQQLSLAWQSRLSRGDLYGTSNVLNNLGNVEVSVLEFESAKKYYLQAYALRKELGVSGEKQFSSWRNLANVYEELGMMDSSKFFLDLQKQLLDLQPDNPELFGFYNNLGSWFFNQQKYDSARYYYLVASNLIRHNTDSLLIADIYYDIGWTYLQQNDAKRALNQYFYPALRLYQRAEKPVHGLLKLMVNSFEQLNQIDSALTYQKLHTTDLLSSFSQNEAKHLNLLRTYHEVDQTHREKEVLAAKNRLLRFSLIFAGLIVLTLFAGLYLNQRKRKAERAFLIERESRLQGEMITRMHQQESEAMERMSQRLDDEYQHIARTLHDQLGNLLVTARLNLQGMADQMSAQSLVQFQVADESLHNALKSIRLIARQMHEGRINQLSLRSVLEELKTAIEASGRLHVELDLIGLGQHIDTTNERKIFQFIRELVTNVIKYAQATELSIQVVREETKVEIMVADNGRGFAHDFSPQQYGMGLQTIVTDLQRMGGSLEIDSSPQNGATIIIDLPL